MAVIYSQADTNRVLALLGSVRSVGEALAVVESTISMANGAIDQIGQTFFEDAWRTQAKKDIANYIASLQRATVGLAGAPTDPVPTSWSASVKAQVMILWSYVRLVQGQFPPDESDSLQRFGQWVLGLVDDLEYGIREAPKVLGDIAHAASGVVGSALGPLKWYLVGGAVILTAGLVTYLLLRKAA